RTESPGTQGRNPGNGRGVGAAPGGGAIARAHRAFHAPAFPAGSPAGPGRRNRRPSILFLRSFHADNQFPVRTGSWLTTMLGKAKVPLEAALTEQLLDFGPVIAIGRPGEPLPPLGASRFYAPRDGEEWKRHVTEFARDSQLVVVMLGETEGLRWEYDLLAGANWLSKTVFVVPLVKGPALTRVLTIFRNYTGAWGIQIVGRVDADVVAFAPAGKGRLIALSTPGLRT